MGAIEIVREVAPPRRHWSIEEKLRIVAEVDRPGARISRVARYHGICRTQLRRWRQAVHAGELTAAQVEGQEGAMPAPPAARSRPPQQAAAVGEAPEFIPIGMFGEAEDNGPGLVAAAPRRVASPVRPSVAPAKLDERPGVIEVDLPNGVRVRVDAFVNERAFRRVLQVLKAVG